MTQNWKTTILVGVAVAILLAVIYVVTAPKSIRQPAPAANQTPVSTGGAGNASSATSAGNIVPPAATGKIDDTINALVLGATNEQTTISAEEGNSTLINSDSQAINDFGQTYDETQF